MNDWRQTQDPSSLCPELSDAEFKFWKSLFDAQTEGQIDSWDFPWQYAGLKESGLSILPSKNLVTNIGFGHNATHTTNPDSHLANLSRSTLTELVHPEAVSRNVATDQWTFENIFQTMAPAEPGATSEAGWLQKLSHSFFRKSA